VNFSINEDYTKDCFEDYAKDYMERDMLKLDVLRIILG